MGCVAYLFFESVNFVRRSRTLLEGELLVAALWQGWSFVHLWPPGLCPCRTWGEEEDVAAAAESSSQGPSLGLKRRRSRCSWGLYCEPCNWLWFCQKRLTQCILQHKCQRSYKVDNRGIESFCTETLALSFPLSQLWKSNVQLDPK